MIHKQRLSADLFEPHIQDLLANLAHGARERCCKTIAGPTFSTHILKVASAGKSKIIERRKANPTSLAAVRYGSDFYSDEPLPTSYQVLAFSGSPRHLKLWDPAKPTQGLPVLRGHNFSRETWRLIFIGKD